MEKSTRIDKKKLAMSLFCSMLAVPTAADASVVTDGNGVAIDKHPQTGNYEISPDFFNGKVGFKKFRI